MFVLVLCMAVTLLDQFTKHLVLTQFALGEPRPVIRGFLNLTYVRNTGAAWGMLSGLNHWLIGLSVVMLVLLVVFRRSILDDSRLHRVAGGLMAAGIVGNLVDRLRLGFVVDFLDFHVGASHFPAFNVADSAICTGVGLYILSHYVRGRRAGEPATGAPAAAVR